MSKIATNMTWLCFLFFAAIPASASNDPNFRMNEVADAPRETVAEAMIDTLFEFPEQTTFDLETQALGESQILRPQSEQMDVLPTWESWTDPERLSGSIRVIAVMAALSLAPALLLMTTCYVRLVVVLSLLRQALGSQQLPPNQVTTTLAMFLTALIMWPVWTQVHEKGIEPYTNPDVEITAEEAWQAGVAPIREFMAAQISAAGNQADVQLFLDYLDERDATTFADVPLQALLPAFLMSELKVAFLIGFLVFLPFVIIDLVVASVTMSMGWVMVPPTTIALPLKLMLFVLVDGWHYVIQMLLMSFQVG